MSDQTTNDTEGHWLAFAPTRLGKTTPIVGTQHSVTFDKDMQLERALKRRQRPSKGYRRHVRRQKQGKSV